MTDEQFTIHAQQALDFTSLFAELFGTRTFGQPPRVLKLSEVDALSTDGGRKARQSIVLTHKDSDDSSVVCGFVDSARKTAEIRTHAFVSQQFAARHGRGFDLSATAYGELVTDLEGLLKLRRFEYRMVDVAPQRAASVPREAAPAQSSSGPIWLAVGALIGFGLGYLVFGSGLLG